MVADLESLLVKKAQAGVTAESKAILPTPVVDDFPEYKSLSSTSTEEDEEDCALSAPSSLLQKVLPSAATPEVAASSSGDFQGAHPCIPPSAAGSGHCKKALPHRSTRI